MLAFCILAALGDCDNQLTGHITGNLNVGNSKEYLVDVLAQCLPYIGFPRALNVLAILNNAKE
jgi:4-carboxymuconolactone decarboxylase